MARGARAWARDGVFLMKKGCKQPASSMVTRMVAEQADIVGVAASAVFNGIKQPDVVKVRARVALSLIDMGYSTQGVAKRLNIDASGIRHYKQNRERWL